MKEGTIGGSSRPHCALPSVPSVVPLSLLKDNGTTLGTEGKAQWGLLEPPIVPSFIGFTTPIAREGDWQFEFGIAMIRPFQNRLTYLNGPVRVQTEQQFTRFRAAFAAEWRPEESGLFHSVALGVGLDLGYT